MYTLKCRECGGTLRRSKRKFSERFRYLEAYRCSGCGARYHVTMVARWKQSRYAKCPKCRHQDVTPLRRIDKIDGRRGGIFNLFHRVLGGQLYHCWFCRLQFYDLRPRSEDRGADTVWLRGEDRETVDG